MVTTRRPRRYRTPARIGHCVTCGATFTTHIRTQVYCMPSCRPSPKTTTASTTERGYGTEHQRRRREMLPSAYGTPCPLCGEVMLEDQSLDLDHIVPLSVDPSSTASRISHSTCNRSRGSQTRTRTHQPQPRLPVRDPTRAW
jgi:5-methylcytosine-specific restriction endonuclease McrA